MFDGMAMWIRELVQSVLLYIGTLVVWLLQDVQDYFWLLLPPALKDFLASDVISGLLVLLQDVTYFIPFWQTMGVLSGVLLLVGMIRLLRWVVSLIPNWIVGGG